MGKTQVHIQVEEDRKADWKQWAEEHPDWTSLSKYIRNAVDKYHDDSQDSGGESTTTEVDLSPVLEGQAHTEKELSQLKESISEINTKLEEVNREVTSGSQKRPLEVRLREALPPAKPKTRAWSRVRQFDPDAPQYVWETAWSGKVTDLAKRVGEKPAAVEDKLDELGFPSSEIDGEKRYWLEEVEIDNSEGQ